jgi:predicted RNA-binding protein with PUA-like domain
MKYWLVKTEPDVYSIDDLARDGKTLWSGVRNYQARNFLREMRLKDTLLIYHSNAEPPGVVGVGEICREHLPDPTQFETGGEYFDPKSTKDNPRWSCPEVAFVRKLPGVLPLQALREEKMLEGLLLLQPGSRLSVIPVSESHFRAIIAMSDSAKGR